MDLLKELEEIKHKFLSPIKVDTDVIIDDLVDLLNKIDTMDQITKESFLMDIIKVNHDDYFENMLITDIAKAFQYVTDYNKKYYYIDNFGYINNVTNEFLLRTIHRIELYI